MTPKSRAPNNSPLSIQTTAPWCPRGQDIPSTTPCPFETLRIRYRSCDQTDPKPHSSELINRLRRFFNRRRRSFVGTPFKLNGGSRLASTCFSTSSRESRSV